MKLSPRINVMQTIGRRIAIRNGLVGMSALGAVHGTGVTAQLQHHFGKAQRVIYLFQSGGPSHLDLLDYKPKIKSRFDEDIPASIFGTQRVSGMVAGQSRFPTVPSMYDFKACGQSGMMLSEKLPYLQKVADEICLINSMHTEAINHDPAITFLQTGSQLPGRPSLGAWVNYGLNSSNKNLPGFVVLNSVPSSGKPGQGLLARLWGSGFLPSEYQGVQFRSGNDPVLFLNDPKGVSRSLRREMLDGLGALNRELHQKIHDPEILARSAQYEMAYRMQESIPELADTKAEPEHSYQLYGEEARKPGTFAANCLLARRLAERGCRFIQLYHRGWDHHGAIQDKIPLQTKDTDQASAALVMDLKQRGLLEDTLVIWGGEFGRTPYAQGNPKPNAYGRDHHGKAFSIWMAGAGVKAGHVHGMSDDYGFNVIQDGIHVHDLHATILHALGIDHERLTYRFQGRQYRLTDVHGKVEKRIFNSSTV